MSELINANGKAQCFSLPVSGKTTQLAVSATSAVTATLDAGIYRLESTVECFVAAGPSALVTDMPIAASVGEYFSINTGGTIAAIAASAGTLRLTLC